MDIQRLLQQILGRLLRQWINKGIQTGVSKAVDMTARKADPGDPEAQRQQAVAGKDMAKRLQQTQKMLRRFRR